jgi:hypothetical protein
MSLISSNRFGNRSSARFRPRAEQASIQIIPLSSSCIPLRMVSRSHPNSRSALRCPPVPIALTARAINRRRVLPFNSLAVPINSDLTLGVSSIFFPPRYRALYTAPQYLGGFIFCKSLILQAFPLFVNNLAIPHQTFYIKSSLCGVNTSNKTPFLRHVHP